MATVTQGPAGLGPEGEVGGPPDLALLERAAGTFHSEFLTRVVTEAGPRARKWWLLGSAVAAVLVLTLAASVQWWRDPPQRSVAPPRAASVSEHAAPLSKRPTEQLRTPDSARQRESHRVVRSQQKRPTPRSRRPRAARQARSQRHGYLNLSSVPWSHVTIDGRRIEDTTPLLQHELAAGVHTVVLESHVHGLRRVLRVRILPGETTRKLVRLR